MISEKSSAINFSSSASGFIAVLVGFTSAVAILFEAASATGASTEQTSSMIAALCFGAGLTSIVFSLCFKKPLLMAFSTPGAALLASNQTHARFSDFIGAFLLAGILTALAGFTGWFERILNRIPTSLASAMLAGVLLKFGLDVFTALRSQVFIVSMMLAMYLAGKRFAPRFTVLGVLFVGLIACAFVGILNFDVFTFGLSTPVFTTPTFNLAILLGVGVPLFVVAMASQNLTGIAVMRTFGYVPPVSAVVTWTGFTTVFLAPFGTFGINFAAITAAIVMSPESHPDPAKRFHGSVVAGFFYIVVAIFAATVISFFRTLPKEFVMALAGIALFSTIATSLAGALHEEKNREPAIITFLVTASGVSLFSVGSAFWGLVAGTVAMILLPVVKS